MYINFKSKYKKIFWILLGFILSCIYVHKVYAFDYHGYNIDDSTYNTIWRQIENKTLSQLPTGQDYSAVSGYDTYTFNRIDYPYLSITKYRSDNTIQFKFFKSVSDFLYDSTYKFAWIKGDSYFSSFTVVYDPSNNTVNKIWLSAPYQNYYFNEIFYQYNYRYGYEQSVNNFDIQLNSSILWEKSIEYSTSSVPDYLQGYTEITLDPGERYVIFSSSTITSGSVYIPISDFNDYGSRISYFDKDIDTQPYTSYIQDFTTTSDGLYAKQDFDLSTYTGSDFIMFSKYIYLEGPDDFSSSVWVPSSMYSSVVEVTPNNTGGNDFDYSYVDENGELQANVISSSDLSQGSPLVSDLFTNFTTKDYGLSSIITAPIPLLQTLNNTSCSTVELPLGVFGGVHDQKLSLPCMTPIYSSIFGELFTLYQTISSGVVAYFVGLAYFNRIKQLKDPDNDSIEVVDL